MSRWVYGLLVFIGAYAATTSILYKGFWDENENKCFWGGLFLGLLGTNGTNNLSPKVQKGVVYTTIIMSALSILGITMRANDLSSCSMNGDE